MAIPFTTDTKRKELDARIEALEHSPVPPVPPVPAEYYLHILTFNEPSVLGEDVQLMFSSTSAETYEIEEGVTQLNDWYRDVYLNPNNKIVLLAIHIPSLWASYSVGDIQIGYVSEAEGTIFITFSGHVSWYSFFGVNPEEYPLTLKSDVIVQLQ